MCMSQLLQNTHTHTHTQEYNIVSPAFGLVTQWLHNHDHGQNHKTP